MSVDMDNFRCISDKKAMECPHDVLRIFFEMVNSFVKSS